MALQQIVEQIVIGLGYDLVEIERCPGGLLRITIDLPWAAPVEGAPALPEPFITVEDCEKVTRQLQFALEVDGVDYKRLEVSSPGIDRPLRHEQDFVRFAGSVIDIRGIKLGGKQVQMVGNLIYSQFLTARDWPFGAALSFFLIAIMLILLFVQALVARRAEGGRA